MTEERPKYPARGKGKNTLMLDAIREEMDSDEGEHEFLKRVIRASLKDKDGEPNPTLLNLVVSRITPPLKSTAELVDFEFDKDSKPHKQAAQVLHAISKGEIPADVGATIISAIKSVLDIEENTELKDRIEKIEAILNGES